MAAPWERARKGTIYHKTDLLADTTGWPTRIITKGYIRFEVYEGNTLVVVETEADRDLWVVIPLENVWHIWYVEPLPPA